MTVDRLIRGRSPVGRAAVLALACAAVLGGCSSSNADTGSSTSPTPASGSSGGLPGGLTTRSTSIGTVLSTTSGFTVYELAGATASDTKCTGGCQSIWPPVMSGGHQVVIGGHPCFTFVGDTAPGQTKGNGLTDQYGLWWALGPSGQPVGSSAGSSGATSGGHGTTSTTTTSPSYGGY